MHANEAWTAEQDKIKESDMDKDLLKSKEIQGSLWF